MVAHTLTPKAASKANKKGGGEYVTSDVDTRESHATAVTRPWWMGIVVKHNMLKSINCNYLIIIVHLNAAWTSN
jgi:hypothetical protein